MADDQARIQNLERTLPVHQQTQIKTQVAAYRTTLTNSGIPKANVDKACFVFWKTIVEKLYGVSAPPPPPPPKRTMGAHPLAVPANRAPATNVFQLVDKSNGLLGRLMPGASLPVGMQDWVNRVFMTPSMKDRKKAELFVTDTVKNLTQKGQLWTANWVSVPTEPPQEIIDFEPAAKARKLEEDFIPISSGKAKKNEEKPLVVTTGPELSLKKRYDAEEMARRQQRAMKYKDHLVCAPTGYSSSPEPEEITVQYEFGNDEEDVLEKTGRYSVVGTCKTMEKRYLRLTSAPDPSLVRPEPVLKKWVSQLEKLWNEKQKEWKYIEDQMRAIRQDLTVQNLRGSFTRNVYELNARWALEARDLGQFNQCQTQLRQVHETSDDVTADVRVEFLAYRLLYYTLQNLRVDEQIFLNQVLTDGNVESHPFMKFALKLRTALATSNFSLYFRLCRQARTDGQKTAPSHAHYLLHAFEVKQRMQALLVLTKAIATPISVEWLSSVLDFDTSGECAGCLMEQNAVMKSDGFVDPKASYPAFSESPLLVSSKLKLMG
jgi:hypothetical protein